MPKAAADYLQRQIARGSEGINTVIESLSQVDSQAAKAWKDEDERKVQLGLSRRAVVFQLFDLSRVMFKIISRLFAGPSHLGASEEVIDPGARLGEPLGGCRVGGC